MSIAQQPHVLLIETSGRTGFVALAHADRLLGIRRLDEARRHARDLAPKLQELFHEHDWNARRLDVVFVGRGPGSYTGLRVGIMSAKTLAYATGCVLLGIDTFAIIANQAPPEAQRLEVLADAQQGKVYRQSFHRTEEGWQAASELRIVPVDDWRAWRDADSWFGGPGLVRYASHFSDNIPRLADSDPGPESLLQLGLQRYFAGERDDLYTLEPLYLRPSAAETQRQKRDQQAAG